MNKRVKVKKDKESFEDVPITMALPITGISMYTMAVCGGVVLKPKTYQYKNEKLVEKIMKVKEFVDSTSKVKLTPGHIKQLKAINFKSKQKKT